MPEPSEPCQLKGFVQDPLSATGTAGLGWLSQDATRQWAGFCWRSHLLFKAVTACYLAALASRS